MSEENLTTETPEVDAVAEAPEATDAVETVEETPEVTAEAPVEDTAEAGEDAPASAPVVRVPAPGEVAQTVGRRKEAVVRVRLTPGSGQFRLNGKSLEEYFPNKVHQQLIREPLVILDKPELFDVRANLKGGGITGQAGALRLAIARALIEIDAEDRPALKKAGFLTRDPRVKERKKYGLKKARKAPQYSKR
ncbi:30S ribosomal protein S9 [Actinosynnema sp. ALI-1.44]|uniref:30S ribosomal protein S9 n=1 Tax=Actinosynnema sp. ALI-1.44 TaxID=1933779 RepID=UPI00097C8B73|nr:30S ribosomal protein S9 [Actinosynnema sp. ALI-1.44]ONI73368.1 30S ribosomal protein S9 [Actinosynnema sp. ALI-1.44]